MMSHCERCDFSPGANVGRFKWKQINCSLTQQEHLIREKRLAIIFVKFKSFENRIDRFIHFSLKQPILLAIFI